MSRPNIYFDRAIEGAPRAEWPPVLLAGIDAAKAGTLAPGAMCDVGAYPPGSEGARTNLRRVMSLARYKVDPRRAFISEVGFTVPSAPWLDSLAVLLTGWFPRWQPRVLEVCAGQGTLVQPMRDRGIDWQAMDQAPRGPCVQEGDAYEFAREAVRAKAVDAIFASWIPLGSDLDKRLCRLGVPVILEGEPPGGCTGCEDLDPTDRPHEPYRLQYAADVIVGWQDPPQWYGLHDLTMIATPTHLPAFARCRQ